MKYNWYFYKNLYTQEECDELVSAIDSHPSKIYFDVPGNGKKVDVKLSDVKDIKQPLEKFLMTVESLNQEIFGFNLFPSGPKAVNLNRYMPDNGEYPYHIDGSGIGTAHDIKLTAILNCSKQSFTGGEFLFWVGKDQQIIELNEPGNMLIFPSFLYHKVCPVTSGERITLSAWFNGPNWK
jgi:PKHD-type hydroxylase